MICIKYDVGYDLLEYLTFEDSNEARHRFICAAESNKVYYGWMNHGYQFDNNALVAAWHEWWYSLILSSYNNINNLRIEFGADLA